ncbi:uncharacterized protein TNCT_667433 [Trichonephila clavata]|uniref:Centromere protein J n=1 Tax=Trichonephila clavata TaxID=2740835 RepID=A0A8X6KZW1_TRICU|nr:uncharacterized protein TNCT_667433 [Trichonephila clavata]
MADFWKDSPNAPKLSDVRTVISQLRAWSENQRQKFLNKQLIEHQNLLEHSGIRKLELQLNQQQSHEDNNDVFAKNEKGKDNVFDKSISESENTQDSSVTGHILRCFSDSSFDSSNLNGNKDTIYEKTAVPIREFVSSNDILPREVQDLPETINSIPKRPKQPFLKKRSGLLRYMPKQNKNVTKHNKITELQDSDFETQRKTCLKLKPAFQSIKLPHKENHEQFREPDLFIYTKNSHLNKTPQEEVKSIELFDKTEPRNLTNSGKNEEKSENPNFDKINSCDDSINTETKELAEFEMLESCAQNSSFNSDSSVVQRVLQVKSVQPMYKIQKPDFPSDPEIISDQSEKPFTNPTNSGKLNFEKFLEEQQHLEDLILDTDRKIDSLQEKTNRLNKNAFDEKRDLIGERCSTPVEQKNVLSATVSDTDLHKESRSSIFVPENDYAKNIEGLNAGAKKNIFPEERYESKVAFQDDKDTFPMASDEFDIKSTFSPNLRQKMEELEKEIQIYQKLNSELEKEKQTYKEHNARLIAIRKDRDENLKNLQKGWDELQKHKAEEEKKLEAKAKQLKMREETYNRYQKLRQDNPTRKEREELSVLRQEVEKLQEELKKQRIRFTNENKRLKNQLVAAEHERDTLKLENITLEEQCQDLLAVLKTRNIKKKPAAQTKDTHRNKKNITSKPNPHQDLNEPSDSSESITKIKELNDQRENVISCGVPCDGIGNVEIKQLCNGFID